MASKSSSHEIAARRQAKLGVPGEIGGVPIRCACTAIVKVEELMQKRNPKNPKKHKAKQLALYWKIITQHGWRRAVVVSLRSGLITKGHGAVEAAARNGAEFAPVDYQHYDNEEQELADMLADNRLADLAENDEDKLRAVLSGLADKLDLELTGFDQDDLQRMIREAEDVEPEFPIAAKLHESYDYVVIATTNESDFQYLQTLCGVRTEKSYKNSHFGIGRVVPFDRFMQSLRENHHSIHVTRGDDDHAPPAADRRRVRAGKSAQ